VSMTGLKDALRPVVRRVRRVARRLLGRPGPGGHADAAYGATPSKPAEGLLERRVLIIAEASIPQCLKYRVVQRQEAFLSLGVDCSWIPWTDLRACQNALQTHSQAILYRVPAHEPVLGLVREARRLRVRIGWECDDLIFDAAVLERSRALARLDRRTFRALLEGARLYRDAMLSCDFAVASTPALAAAMRASGASEVHVVENGLDRQTLGIADKIAAGRGPVSDGGPVRIVYGSGTNTHDVDFEEAAPAIARILDMHPHARLRLIGPVAIPPELSAHARSIERMPATGYADYLERLAECDISIAPLEDFVFNDSKSGIKYLEASILGLPSACSPRAEFARAIEHGRTGFLCSTGAEWEAALDALVRDAALRRSVGAAAEAHVRTAWSPSRIARDQVARLLGPERPRRGVRALSVNVFYRPQSFGGATIVAESVNRIMDARHGVSVDVFTTVPPRVAPEHSLCRYEAGGLTVLGMGLATGAHDGESGFDSAGAERCFLEAISATRPDIVHFHSIQGIGLRAAEACRRLGIPYAVTLHDAWWICGRQFMIDRSGRYCGQSRIDPSVCARCVASPGRNAERMRRARAVLEGAALLLAPSRFFADLHAANGFTDVQVNRNGIARPDGRPRIRHDGPLRFGYVGGNTAIKGFHLVRKAFIELGEAPIRLVLVDNTMNLGVRSFGRGAVRGIRDVQVLPAYTGETIDDFFAGIDVLLFPTQWKESFGLTVREAIARDVWVIATDAGGVTEDIKPGINGTVIPFGDDGPALRAAILGAVERFGGIPVGMPVRFDGTGVRFWEEQAEELAGMLRAQCARPSPAPFPVPTQVRGVRQ
jgi:glycosyltransferase involved in cell wall biosynthesis